MPAPLPVTDDLLDDLTPPQREAVTHVDGPLLVLAGAGSGKTRVITRRIAHLILRVGIPPWNVLAITFTNKAAGEMQQRVAQLVSAKQAAAVTVCTFHSLCARILRIHSAHLNLPSGYSIYDTADQQRAVKQALEELEISTTHFPPSKVLHTISTAKNELTTPEAFAKNANDFFARNVAKIFAKYQQILERNHALDFDDLMLKTVELFRGHADVLHALRQRYQYILIDEYQDTNHAQFVIANALAAQHKNLCATGDPDQSIYGWRGANIRNILEFEAHYPNAVTVRLEQNYRSTKNILAAADALIQHNTQRKHKSLWTENDTGVPVRIITAKDERDEARFVVEHFQTMHREQGTPWSAMAVFYRINSLSRVVEDALRTAGVPYQIARGTAFYDRKEIKDAVAYLRALANPADEVNLLRIINSPTRGISDRTVKSLQAYATSNQMTLSTALANPMAVPGLNNRASSAVQKFAHQLDAWRAAAGFIEAHPPSPDLTLKLFVEDVLRESGLHEHYQNDKTDPDQERLANLGELVSSAQQFEQDVLTQADEAGHDVPPLPRKLEAFLEQIALVSDVDGVDNTQGAVTLMTLHAAKGLEFPLVAIVGVEDGLLPHERANTSDHELQEERRLCFVGITRAMHQLLLTHARYRTVFGTTRPALPSRFFSELPPPEVTRRETTTPGDDEDEDDSAALGAFGSRGGGSRSRAADLYPIGQLVRHPSFGLGRVVQVQPMAGHTRLRIHFNTVGDKTLIHEFAPLERVT
jgi:DNA helicase-2/ATP-dependent DNA helicase PcrA